ncbi:MAG TPA: MFS transporter [Polyangiaceae bacterium]|nr:MFS transporter [Polyangiaceae bacterium]
MTRETRLLLLAYLAFISLGLPDATLGIAWPSLQQVFQLPPSAIGLVLGMAVSGYFLSGLLAGRWMQRAGVGSLLAGSSALVALGLTGYALAPAWGLFFPVAFLVGLGSGAIDAALNAYAARHFSVRHVNWLHACWGVGASTGPAIMTSAIALGGSYRAGYGVIAAALAVMALAFVATRRAWDRDSSPSPASPSSASLVAGSAREALGSGRVWLLMGSFFLYSGLETSVGQWCFTWLTEARGLSVEGAGAWTSAYWGSLTLGRVLLGSIAERFGSDRLLRLASLGALAGVTLFALSPGVSGRLGLSLLGMSLAPMYPTLMARTPARVGPALSGHTVGFLVSSATLGSALMPALVGVLVGRAGLASIGAMALALGAAFLCVHELILRYASSPAPPPDTAGT